MADQAVAQSGAVKAPAGGKLPARRALRVAQKLCRFGWWWAWYILVGRGRGIQGLADFVAWDPIVRASQVASELGALGQILADLRPERGMEIGTYAGGTLFFLTRLASPDATIISIDLPGGRFGGGYGTLRKWIYQRFARERQRLHLFQGDSHASEMLNRVKEVLGGQPLDYLFIDGDHTYDGVRSDFEMYGPLVRSGGVIALHDIAEHPPETGCEVSRFWCEIKHRYRHREIIADQHQGWAGIGIIYVP
jgi:predicted O-methyltransferase YrrM